MTLASQTATVLACCAAGFACGEIAGRAAVAAGAHYLSRTATLSYVAAAVTGATAALVATIRLTIAL